MFVFSSEKNCGGHFFLLLKAVPDCHFCFQSTTAGCSSLWFIQEVQIGSFLQKKGPLSCWFLVEEGPLSCRLQEEVCRQDSCRTSRAIVEPGSSQYILLSNERHLREGSAGPSLELHGPSVDPTLPQTWNTMHKLHNRPGKIVVPFRDRKNPKLPLL